MKASEARIVRHKRRGTDYEVVHTGVQVQCAKPICEGDTLVIYKSHKDGTVWARPTDEFNDGRFLAFPDERR
jgi:hypothetical protein